MNWFNGQVKRLFLEENTVSKGIPLQLCDVFLQELNKVDAQNISYKNLSDLLSPFLAALGSCKNRTLNQRILEKVFSPLLENNITPENASSEDDTDDSSSEINYDPKLGKYVDGGKLPPKTQKEIQKMIDQRFHFPNFNILLYSQEYIFKQASSATETRDENRDELYKLYDKAMKMEPEGEPELTFAQRMTINRAHEFITKRMERRQRVHQQKRNKKLMYKLSNLISNRLMFLGGNPPTVLQPAVAPGVVYHGSVNLPDESVNMSLPKKNEIKRQDTLEKVIEEKK